jgi:hypothetical protein
MKIAISTKILVISIFLINTNRLVAQDNAKEIFTKATQMLTAYYCHFNSLWPDGVFWYCPRHSYGTSFINNDWSGY